jgi:hypothetical protein
MEKMPGDDRFMLIKALELLSSFFKLMIFGCLSNAKNKKEIYLIGSAYGEGLDENAVFLYQHIKSLGKEVYIARNRPSESFHLSRGGWKCFAMYFKCKGVYFTHSLSDILPHAHKLPFLFRFFNHPVKIFLQHGVIGLKSGQTSPPQIKDYLASIQTSTDLMVVSSVWESRIVEQLGVANQKIMITGLPRFDGLKEQDKTDMLVFFTWGKKSKIEQKYAQVKQSSYIQKCINDNVKINFLYHNMMQGENNSIRSLQRKIISAKVLITDNSSLAWDVYHTGGLVIFFQPNLAEWLIPTGIADELQEFVCSTTRQLDSLLYECIEGKYLMRKFDFFPNYKDSTCSQRAFGLVDDYHAKNS